MFQLIALYNDQIYTIIISITSNVYHIFKDLQNLLFYLLQKPIAMNLILCNRTQTLIPPTFWHLVLSYSLSPPSPTPTVPLQTSGNRCLTLFLNFIQFHIH